MQLPVVTTRGLPAVIKSARRHSVPSSLTRLVSMNALPFLADLEKFNLITCALVLTVVQALEKAAILQTWQVTLKSLKIN